MIKNSSKTFKNLYFYTKSDECGKDGNFSHYFDYSFSDYIIYHIPHNLIEECKIFHHILFNSPRTISERFFIKLPFKKCDVISSLTEAKNARDEISKLQNIEVKDIKLTSNKMKPIFPFQSLERNSPISEDHIKSDYIKSEDIENLRINDVFKPKLFKRVTQPKEKQATNDKMQEQHILEKNPNNNNNNNNNSIINCNNNNTHNNNNNTHHNSNNSNNLYREPYVPKLIKDFLNTTFINIKKKELGRQKQSLIVYSPKSNGKTTFFSNFLKKCVPFDNISENEVFIYQKRHLDINSLNSKNKAKYLLIDEVNIDSDRLDFLSDLFRGEPANYCSNIANTPLVFFKGLPVIYLTSRLENYQRLRNCPQIQKECLFYSFGEEEFLCPKKIAQRIKEKNNKILSDDNIPLIEGKKDNELLNKKRVRDDETEIDNKTWPENN
jgi:hypothetical protein